VGAARASADRQGPDEAHERDAAVIEHYRQ
jgi:hypothetical protein